MNMDSNEFLDRIMPMSRKIYAVALRFLSTPAEAEDVVQDIYTRLWQMREKLPPDGQLLPYILTMTRNLCIDRLRARQAIEEEREEPHEEEADEQDHLETNDRLQHLMKLIGQLPDLQRQVIRLRAIDDLTTEQIAQLLNISNDYVRQLLSRARTQLRHMAQTQGIL